ncbi:MAG: hypothetical protein MK078_16285 [Crocinitomicaceae bacterium]|nr:hypothetical protein [Crocinitomicaceae bacterium]
MKIFTGVFFLFLLSSSVTLADNLPSKALGKYAGEKPAYTAVKHDVEISIEEQDVFVTISENTLYYTLGKLSLSGPYSAIKLEGGNYSIKANLTNEKSLNFDLELLWSKKTKNLTILGKNGEPDTTLEQLN